MSDIFQVQGMIYKITTMSKSLRIQYDTLENLSADAMKRLFDLHQLPGYMTISVRQIEKEDIVDLPPVRKYEKGKKTPSKRLREVLFRLWEIDHMGKDDFDDYYEWYMEQLIENLKQRLD